MDKVFEQLLCEQAEQYIEPYLNSTLTQKKQQFDNFIEACGGLEVFAW